MGSTLITRAPCSASIMLDRAAVIMVENSRIVMPSIGFIYRFLFSIEGRVTSRSRLTSPYINGSIIYVRCDRFNPLVRKRPATIVGPPH